MSGKLPSSPRAALAPSAARLLAELRRVRKDPKKESAVHDARVAARKLSATAELWLPALPGNEKLRARLDKCVRRLGRVRNLDVTLETLKTGPPGDEPARRAIARRAKKKLRAERKRLAGWLTDGRVKRLKASLVKAIASSAPAGPAKASGLAPRLKAVLALAAAGRPMDDPERAHELRREIRFLRYQFESVAATFAPKDRDVLSRLFTRLQDAAGAWHDRFIVDRLAAKVEKSSKRAPVAASLRHRLADEMRGLAHEFEEALTGLVALKSVLLGRARPKGGKSA